MISSNRYQALLEKIFTSKYKVGVKRVEFERDELVKTADKLKIDLPKNLGDVIYSVRYRTALPLAIVKTQPKGFEWVIEGAGRARYAFALVRLNRIVPNGALATIALPDATPEIIRTYALDDEQALLAIVRYNRIVDTFLGLTTYSLQNHLRTTVKEIGQIEIDELYFGIDRNGCHYVIPVQAKGGNDQIGVVQIKQDLAWCNERFPGMRCRAISAQFMSDDRVAIFELTLQRDEIRIVDEKHYGLVQSESLDRKAVINYR